MNSATDSLNYSIVCLVQYLFMKNDFQWLNEVIDGSGKMDIFYKRNNTEITVSYEFWMDACTICFIISSMEKRFQFLKSTYCNNGQLVDRKTLAGSIGKKINLILPAAFSIDENKFSSVPFPVTQKSLKNALKHVKIPLKRRFNDSHQNFQALCAGEDYLCYVGSKFTHVFPQYIIRGGDITSFDGSNGESIFGKHFPDENFKNKHNKPGILSMVNAGPNTNSSQFFITSVALPYFDDKYPGGSSCRLKGHRKRPETAIKRHKTALIFTLFRRNPSARFTGRFFARIRPSFLTLFSSFSELTENGAVF
ncbi:unnamed protein product [Rotaria magnacalcarata]